MTTTYFHTTKGSLEDVFLVLDIRCPMNELIQVLKQENIRYGREELYHSNIINYYITEGKSKVSKTKVKQAEQPLSPTEAILQKYLPDLSSRQATNASSTLFLIVWYLDKAAFFQYSSVLEIEECLAVFAKPDIKFVMVLENIKEWIKAETIVNEVITLNELTRWLIRMQMEKGIDHVHTNSKNHTLEIISEYYTSTISAKYCKSKENFNAGKHLNAESAKLGGIVNKYQLEFMGMLMTIHGVTEPKARSIIQKYPSFLALLNAYRRTPVDQRLQMLANITYCKYLNDKDTQKKLGATLSERIYLLLTTSNQYECLYQ